VPPVTDEAVAGETLTLKPPTVTVAVADFVGSATLVAMTMPVTRFAGAVKTPALVMLPTDAVQVTALLVVVPWIAAVNCTFALGAGETADGETAIEVTPRLDVVEDFPTPTQPDSESIVEARQAISARTWVSRGSLIGSALSLFPSSVFYCGATWPALVRRGWQADVE